jgi:hypothetical protein
MTITYTLLTSDFVAAQRVHGRRNLLGRVGPWIIFPVFVLSLVFCILTALIGNGKQQQEALDTLGPFLGVFGFYCFMFFGLPYFVAAKSFAANPNTNHPITLTLTETGFRSLTKTSDSHITWDGVTGWAEDKTIFCLRTGSRLLMPIPKRAFTAEQIEEFREVLEKNTPRLK